MDKAVNLVKNTADIVNNNEKGEENTMTAFIFGIAASVGAILIGASQIRGGIVSGTELIKKQREKKKKAVEEDEEET